MVKNSLKKKISEKLYKECYKIVNFKTNNLLIKLILLIKLCFAIFILGKLSDIF